MIRRFVVGVGVVTVGLLATAIVSHRGVPIRGSATSGPSTSRAAAPVGGAPDGGASGLDGGTAVNRPSTTHSAGGSPIVTPPAKADPPLVSVTVTTHCVRAGGTETVVVTSRPGLQVTVNPRYSDGQYGNVYGGLAFAQTIGPDGTFRETWTVASNAPAGEVVVLAGVEATSGPRVSGTGRANFIVGAQC